MATRDRILNFTSFVITSIVVCCQSAAKIVICNDDIETDLVYFQLYDMESNYVDTDSERDERRRERARSEGEYSESASSAVSGRNGGDVEPTSECPERSRRERRIDGAKSHR